MSILWIPTHTIWRKCLCTFINFIMVIPSWFMLYLCPIHTSCPYSPTLYQHCPLDVCPHNFEQMHGATSQDLYCSYTTCGPLPHSSPPPYVSLLENLDAFWKEVECVIVTSSRINWQKPCEKHLAFSYPAFLHFILCFSINHPFAHSNHVFYNVSLLPLLHIDLSLGSVIWSLLKNCNYQLNA